MKIIIVSATPFEIAPLLSFLESEGNKISFHEFEYKKHTIVPLITGVGMVNTILGLSKSKHLLTADLLINGGIAGSFTNDINLGSVVEITRDRFGDLGIEDHDGSFKDHIEMGWDKGNSFLLNEGWILNNEPKNETGLPKVTGITVNKVHGANQSIERIKQKYNAHVESMEGAAFMLFSKTNNFSFHQIRSISNYVKPRNKNSWNIELAVDNLNNKLIKFLLQLD